MNSFPKICLIAILQGIYFLSFAQQVGYLSFNENWERTVSKFNIKYECECYTLESGAFEGPLKCYLVGTENLIRHYNFVNNVLHGEILEYFSNGNLKLEAFYDRGIPIKTWREWNANGDLITDKVFSDQGKILGDNKKQYTEYEKIYFGTKPFEPPVFTTECIMKDIESSKYKCSDSAMLKYYNKPPLPPYYFYDEKFSGKDFNVRLKYLLSEKGKVDSVYITETSGDAFLDELAEVHILNMTPFEAAKEYENPIKFWIEAILNFSF